MHRGGRSGRARPAPDDGARGARTRAGGLRTAVVTDLDELAALETAWRRLALVTPDANPFASPGWVLARYRHLERPTDVYAVTVWREAELAGIAPFARTRLGGRRAGYQLLVSIGTDQGDDGDPLLGRDPDPVAAAVVGHLVDVVEEGGTAVNLRRLCHDGALLRAVDENEHIEPLPVGRCSTAALVRFDQLDDPAEFLERAARKHDIPRRMRRLTERYADVGYSVSGSAAEIGPLLDAMQDMLGRRWGPDGGPRLFATPELAAFTRSAFGSMAAGGQVWLSTLTAGGRPVAISTVLQVHGRCVSDNPCFEPELAPFGLGQAEMHHMLCHALVSGVTEVDLRGGDFPYKHRWANAERLTRSVVLAPPGRRRQAALAARRVAMSVRARRQRSPAGAPAPAG